MRTALVSRDYIAEGMVRGVMEDIRLFTHFAYSNDSHVSPALFGTREYSS
jgi:hypothetical protein